MLDLLILDEGGNPARPSLTTVVDDHSRAIAGYGVFLGATTAQVRQGGGKARPVGAGAEARSSKVRWQPAAASASC